MVKGRTSTKTTAPDYAGVIATHGEYRVSVSKDGRVYLFQCRRANGWFYDVYQAFGRASLLERLPGELADTPLAAVPASPAECSRPWADLEAERRKAEDASAIAADDYPGEVARDRSARVIVTPSADSYGVQFRASQGHWYGRTFFGTKEGLLSMVLAPRAHAPGRRVVRSAALRAACEALPEYPWDAEAAPRGGPPEAPEGP